MAPVYLTKELVPLSVLAAQTNKEEFYAETVLMEQLFIDSDEKKTVTSCATV